jgi:hypothetical protein
MMSPAMFGPGLLAHIVVAEDEPAVVILDDMESVEVLLGDMADGQEFRLGLYDLELIRHPALPRFCRSRQPLHHARAKRIAGGIRLRTHCAGPPAIE